MSTLSSIDWQLKLTELKQRTGHLLLTGQWSDCTFLVGTAPNQVTMNAHKLILASASPVFEAMFYGSMAEKNGLIEILDIQPEIFTILLEYIYMDKTFIKSFETASAVYYCANKYMLPSLVKECIDFLSLNINPHNVCRTYTLAQLFDEKCLMEKCIQKMMTSTKEILNDVSFEAIDLETLNFILALDHLNIDNELDLFKAIEKYASKHHKGYKRCIDSPHESASPEKKIKSNHIEENTTTDINHNQMSIAPEVLSTERLESTVSELNMLHSGELVDKQQTQTDDESIIHCEDMDSEDTSSIEAYDKGIRSALEKVRFLSLTGQQFAAGPARSPLLSQADAFAVLMHILSPHAHVPMPRGFSTCRLPRNHTVCSDADPSPPAAVFRFTVLGLRTRRRAVVSRPFAFLGLLWTLRLVPHLENDTAGREFKYYGLFFKCAGQAESWSVNASVHARVIAARDGSTHATTYAKMTRKFNRTEPEWGFGRFVSWDEIADPTKSICSGNAITIEAYVIAVQ